MARSETAWRSSVSLRHQMAAAHPQNPAIPFFPAQKISDFGKYPTHFGISSQQPIPVHTISNA
jgi:hypothetical protein